jgi:hypothetical protein
MRSAEREHAGMSCGASCANRFVSPLARHVDSANYIENLTRQEVAMGTRFRPLKIVKNG